LRVFSISNIYTSGTFISRCLLEGNAGPTGRLSVFKKAGFSDKKTSKDNKTNHNKS